MIHAFSFKNFYSFKDETTVDFRVNKNAPKTKAYFVDGSKTRLSKIEMIIGANASGKTNAIKPLGFLQHIICHSFGHSSHAHKHHNIVAVQPFFLGSTKKQPIEMSVIFEMNSNIYTYELSVTQERIVYEKLSRCSVVKKNKSTKDLFERKWDNKKQRYDFEDIHFNLPPNFESILIQDASVISTASELTQNPHKESMKIVEFWEMVETNVGELGWSGGAYIVNIRMRELYRASSLYTKNDKLKKEMERMIRKYDLGLSRFNIKMREKKMDSKGRHVHAEFGVQGIHTIKDKDHILDFEYESSGTKQLFVFLPLIIHALEQGGIAVIDELESNLHSEIVEDIVELFIHPETNPKNAQIIFTMNNHYLLQGVLDKYQVNIVEKDPQEGISELYNLSEFGEHIKKEDDLYRKYNAGAYGGVPNIG